MQGHTSRPIKAALTDPGRVTANADQNSHPAELQSPQNGHTSAAAAVVSTFYIR